MSQSKLFFRDLFDDLVERRLWPVALVLALALVAIPVLLAKPASQGSAVAPVATGVPATGPGGASTPLTAFQPVVSTKQSADRKKDLGSFKIKNPFAPKGLNFSGSDAAGTVEPVTTTTGAATTTGGGGAAGQDAVPATDQPSGSGGTETKYYTYSVTVKFGAEGATKTKALSQFRALPSTENPIVIFMGVKRGGKTAVFLMSSSSTTTGDGDCKPSDTSCTFLYLQEGDKQVIETVTAEGDLLTYELELAGIEAKATALPSTASSSGKDAGTSAGGFHESDRERAARQRHSHLARLLRSFDSLDF